ncbi:MAG: XdhC family protein [Burkholderiales bacterium]|nr:XdhC family protein [Burkholderiales bacterium]
MDSVDLDVLKTSSKWLREGHGAYLATVVRTWGSAPRPIGAMTVIRDDGMVTGSVSGGCVEDDLVDKVKSGGVAVTTPELVVYGVTREQAERFGLPCGGTLELVVERLGPGSGIEDLIGAIGHHQVVTRRLDMASGRVDIKPGRGVDGLEFDGTVMTTVHGPRWRLLLIGAGQLSRFVAQFAQALDYQVIICDPREEYAEGWDVPGAMLTRAMPDDVVRDIGMDAHTAVVAATHDPKLDDMALLEALRSPAFYVGAIGSRLNNHKRRQRLSTHFDMTEAELDRLHGPVGLKLGGKTPAEIALSILAEMTAVRYGMQLSKADKGTVITAAVDPFACSAAA